MTSPLLRSFSIISNFFWTASFLSASSCFHLSRSFRSALMASISILRNFLCSLRSSFFSSGSSRKSSLTCFARTSSWSLCVCASALPVSASLLKSKAWARDCFRRMIAKGSARILRCNLFAFRGPAAALMASGLNVAAAPMKASSSKACEGSKASSVKKVAAASWGWVEPGGGAYFRSSARIASPNRDVAKPSLPLRALKMDVSCVVTTVAVLPRPRALLYCFFEGSGLNSLANVLAARPCVDMAFDIYEVGFRSEAASKVRVRLFAMKLVERGSSSSSSSSSFASSYSPWISSSRKACETPRGRRCIVARRRGDGVWAAASCKPCPSAQTLASGSYRRTRRGSDRCAPCHSGRLPEVVRAAWRAETRPC
mmetsp:Transcript_11941/g.35669  ORF Transcript_11941/g.35669 Transcript_11941/m.35669 type:complete len:370 (-) Transcript_11941:22-1131(-)